MLESLRSLRHLLFFSIILAPLFVLPGCLITTQSYNHGKLLNPGERLATHGFGCLYSSRYQPIQSNQYDAGGIFLNGSRYDSTRFGWFTYTYDYRVGVLRKYPFGKGLEAGYHLEMAYRGNLSVSWNGATRTEPEFYGPPVLEIDTRFGLPDMTLRKCIYHHNVNAGWIVGYWVDNGWFLGYAAGWEFERVIPYVSSRIALSATNAINRSLDSNFFKTHDRKLYGRICGGVSCKLPFNYSIVPEFVTPECSLMFPNFSTGQHVGFGVSVGVRWLLGQ
jgi:hypothetical protein